MRIFDSTPRFTNRDADEFSDSKHDCRRLFFDHNGKPVCVSQSKTVSPIPWLVQDSFSSVWFTTLADAVAYCKKHYPN